MDQAKETWVNKSAGVVWVWKYDRRGDLKDEVVPSGGKLTITTAERQLNMDQASSVDLDIFSNGNMSPVRLLEGTEDAAEIASNPNLISDSDMQALFDKKTHWRTFEAKINDISNVGTLTRILDMTKETDATLRQVEVIKNRIEEVSPKSFNEHTVTQVGRTVSGPVTP